MREQQKDVMILLNAIGAGDQNPLGRVLELVYDDLRRPAGKYLQEIKAKPETTSVTF